MSGTNKLKILNDPIYGFVPIPNPLVYDLIEHPYFQRLRRISQMGLSYLVYPGAHHTRFHHAIGAMHMMQRAIDVLRYKGIPISDPECTALLVAILLHDIGHGPFSHAMEHSIVEAVSHEQISLLFMDVLNQEFGGKLSLSIQIFKGEYHRKFMLQLISSQLDMDRMDYLKRDSFYTGVAEGNINSDRLIQMMNVENEQLVLEEKGIYSVEKFLVARRLMYWQAYLHKTSLVAELILTKALRRARELLQKGEVVFASAPLLFFMEHKIGVDDFSPEVLSRFAELDDVDIMAAVKTWQSHPDAILSALSKMIVNRDLPKVKLSNEKFSKEELALWKQKLIASRGISAQDAAYYVFKGKVKNQAYNKDVEPIHILNKDKSVDDVLSASDQYNLKALARPVIKYYLCYPKHLIEK